MSSLIHSDFRCLFVAALLCVWLLLPSGARADYTVALLSDGSPARSVRVGEEFNLDIQMISGAGDQLSSADFRVEFSSPGLRLASYEWSLPFVTGGLDDVSIPAMSALPSIITNDLAPDGPAPANRADIFLSNLTTNTDGFRDGRMMRLRLAVPEEYIGLDTLDAQIVVESFGNGFSVIPATAAEPFKLRIQPASGQGRSALSIALLDGALSLSWPANIDGARLQTAADLTGAWTDVLQTPQLADGRNLVQLPFQVGVASRFFRLKLP